ncbi:MAG: hypothetical protein ABSD02_12505 [Steroidobacteraceae bacterium]
MRRYQEELRRTLISELGSWGDAEVIRGARLRFDQFLKNPASLPASDQPPILAVVAYHADAGTFEQLIAGPRLKLSQKEFLVREADKLPQSR